MRLSISYHNPNTLSPRSTPEIVEEDIKLGMEWKTAPVYTGSTHFELLEDVKNIMITGGAGFIASYLVRHLTLNYPSYKIISFDKLDSCSTQNNTHILDEKPNFRFCYGDVTDQKSVMRCMKENNIDTIFHFAAQSHVDLSFGNSFEFTKTNVEGTHVMLESAVQVGTVMRFIHISTDEVNGEVDHDEPDLLENCLLKPTNPYAASKAAAEMYVHAYSKSFKLPVVIVRSNNVYGPHQYPEKIIPKFTCLLCREKPLMIHGDGTHTRRYLFASDAADAFDTILHRGALGEIYNVGSSDEISNLDLALKLLEAFGKKPTSEVGSVDAAGTGTDEWIQHVKDRPFNDKRYAVDASKLRSLGWEQKTSFEDGLKVTVEWYRRFGASWWGDIEGMLTPFPELREGVPAKPLLEAGQQRINELLEAAPAVNGSGNSKGLKRGREPEGDGKENVEMEGEGERGREREREGRKKKFRLGEDLSNGNGEVVR